MRTLIVGLAWALIGAAFAPLPASAMTLADGEEMLVLGRISDNPKAHYEQLKPLLDYVVPRMADVGITGGRVLMARDTQQMTSYLRRGHVDWVTETAGTGMQLQIRAGAKALLLTERGGVSNYHSVFFVRKDSGIETLPDLVGRSVAFQNTSSTSAYFVPASTLLDRGLQLEILLAPSDRPASNSVGYVFARSELNIAAWVHKRLVDAGVLSSQDWEDPQRVPASFRQDLRIIHETPDYPRAVEMVRGDMDTRVQARLRQVLLEAEHDAAGREALRAFFNTSRFLPVDAEAQRALERVRRAVSDVREQVE